MPNRHFAVFLVSAVGIAYQIALMRVFSIAQWHHFAYMIISVCMLGFASSGTALALLRRRIAGREAALLETCCLLLILAPAVSYAASQAIPFETFRLTTDASQFFYLAALYLVLSVPFALVSATITLAFFLERARVGRVYFFNMAGSGAGALTIALALYATEPAHLPSWLALPAAAAFVSLQKRRSFWRKGALPMTAFLLLAAIVGAAPIRLSEYKGLSYALQLPDARVLARAHSPMGEITAVSSRMIRETPGQIANYPMAERGPLPEQIALFFDGGGNSTVYRFDGDWDKLAFFDYVTGAMPYRLTNAPSVFVVGAGGGAEILNALYHGAKQVTAAEADPRVQTLMRGQLAEFSGGLYLRPDVAPIQAEARGWLEAQRDARFDLIQISLLDSFNASAAGVHALSESYLYTVDAFALYLDRLSPNGVLTLTRWLKTPARDAIKTAATLIEAAEAVGIENPGDHLAVIRSWNTATLALSKTPLTAEQIAGVRDFSAARQLDLCWLPGLTRAETNRFTALEEPVYFEAIQRLLSPEREAFYREFLFDIRPAVDDRPYFSHFFRWKALPTLLDNMGAEWIPFVEWGYLTLIATVIQALLASLLLLAPMLFRKRERNVSAQPTVLYFGALGFAFMFLEMAMIQKFMLFLAYPVFAVSVVLTALLTFAGLGSRYADRRRGPRLMLHAFTGLALLALAYLFGLPPLFSLLAGWPVTLKIVASVAFLAPLAFLMGVPFPAGLQRAAEASPALIPWAWCINGCASVLGATLGAMLAMELGFTLLVAFAILLYGVAALAFPRLTTGARLK